MATSTLYPSVEQVFNLARVYLNDTMPGITGTIGEGRRFIDTWTPNLTILNVAIATYQNDIENSNVPALRKEVIIPNIPIVNGVNGPGSPDTAVQQFINFAGFFDGTNQTATPSLPVDLIVPLQIMQRNATELLTFSEVAQAPGSLESRYQDFSLGMWEWRFDAIYWNGALVPKDVRIRYQATAAIPISIPVSQFGTTTIQLLDSLEALAYRVAFIFSGGTVGLNQTDALLNMYNLAVNRVIQRYTRQKQGIGYERHPFGETGDMFGWFH